MQLMNISNWKLKTLSRSTVIWPRARQSLYMKTAENAVYNMMNMMNLPKNSRMNFQIISDDSYFPFYLLFVLWWGGDTSGPLHKLFKTFFFVPLEKYWIQSLQICELPPTCLCVGIESVYIFLKLSSIRSSLQIIAFLFILAYMN